MKKEKDICQICGIDEDVLCFHIDMMPESVGGKLCEKCLKMSEIPEPERQFLLHILKKKCACR